MPKADSYADLVDWGAKLYYAVALANGGNPEMMAQEDSRLAVSSWLSADSIGGDTVDVIK